MGSSASAATGSHHGPPIAQWTIVRAATRSAHTMSARVYRRVRARGPWAVSGRVTGSAAPMTSAATRWASARGAGGTSSEPPRSAPRPTRSPVAMAIRRAPATVRRRSGSLTSIPCSRRSSIVVARVVMSPRVTWRVPPGWRGRRKSQKASAYPTIEATTTAASASSSRARAVSTTGAWPSRSARWRAGPQFLGSKCASLATLSRKPSTTPTETTHERVKGAKRTQLGSRRASSVSAWTAAARAGAPGGAGGLRLGGPRGGRGGRARRRGSARRRRLPGAVQQLRAQRDGFRRGEAVEAHAAALPAIGAPGADLDAREPEQPVHRPRGDVDGADAVPRDGAHAAPEEARADLDAVLGRPIARGEPAREGEGERDGERDADPDQAAAAAVAGDEGRQQRWERARDLLDGVDEQHAAIEPPPGAALGCRHVPSPRVAWAALVSSSTSRSAVARSSPSLESGPAADAVVTVTSARPKSCSSGPRSLSTVWMREIGAMRDSWYSQPARV